MEKSAAVAAPSAKPGELTLLQRQALDARAGDAPAARGKKRQLSVEALVNKAIRENAQLKTLDAWTVDGIKVGGKTMRERMVADRYAAVSGESTLKLGKIYYADLVERYQALESPEKRLKARDPNAAIDPKLFQAVVMLKKKPANKKPLIMHIQTCEKIKQEELIAVFRFALKENVRAVAAEPRENVLDVMRLVTRLGLQTEYRDELAIMTPCFSAALEEVWKHAKGAGQTPEDFFLANDGLWQLVLPAGPVDALRRLKTAWRDEEAALQSVVASGPLGASLFGFALTNILCQVVEEKIAAGLEELAKNPSVGTAEILKSRRALFASVEATPNIDTLPERREVTLKYRGQSFTLRVSCLAEQIDAATSCWVKSVAAARGQVPGVNCEEDLLQGTDWAPPEEGATLKEQVLGSTRAARTLANKLLATATGDGTFQATLVAAHNKLTALDKHWRIEAAFFRSMEGDSGAALLQQRCLALLPSSSEEKDVASASQDLVKLCSGELFRFCSPDCQGAVRAVANWVAALQVSQTPPKLPEEASSFHMEAHLRLQWFCTFKKGDTVLRGVGALAARLGKLVKKEAKDVTLEEIDAIEAFKYLLTPDELSRLQTVQSKVAEHFKGAFKRARNPTSKADVPASKRQQGSTPGSDEVLSAAAMFK